MIKAKHTETVVTLDSVRLTERLWLEKIAHMNTGYFPSEDGILAEDSFCVYYRVRLDGPDGQFLTDWSGSGISKDTDKLIKFLLEAKE